MYHYAHQKDTLSPQVFRVNNKSRALAKQLTNDKKPTIEIFVFKLIGLETDFDKLR